jgi:hypothetical protein
MHFNPAEERCHHGTTGTVSEVAPGYLDPTPQKSTPSLTSLTEETETTLDFDFN